MYSACFAAIELFVAFTHAYSRGTLKLSDRIKKLLGKMTWPRKVITLKTNRKFKDQPDRHRPSEYMFSQAQGDFSNAHMILLQTFIVQQRKCVEDIEELVKEAHTERKNRAKQERNKKKKKEINTSFPDTLQQKVVGLIRKIDWCYTEYFKGCFLYLKLRSFVRAQEVKFDEGDVTKPLSITSIWERGDVVFAAIVDAPEELSPAPFLPLTPGFVESESDDEGSEGPSGGTIASTAGSKVKVTAQQRTSSSKSHRAREASEVKTDWLISQQRNNALQCRRGGNVRREININRIQKPVHLRQHRAVQVKTGMKVIVTIVQTICLHLHPNQIQKPRDPQQHRDAKEQMMGVKVTVKGIHVTLVKPILAALFGSSSMKGCFKVR
jgi:hypothetical protein